MQKDSQTEKDTEKARVGVSLAESIRTFSAAVGTTAVLMLTFCGLVDMIFPEEEPALAASVFGEETADEPLQVQLGGDVFGIRLFSDGVIVAALSDIYTDSSTCCPAKEAGIEAGDYVLTANGQELETNADLAEILAAGDPVTLTLRRDGEILEKTITPARCGDTFRAGMWIRDSAAGIGTVTYYSADGTEFAALGHGICDADTREILTLREGEPADILICGIERGRSGAPGRLRGYFTGLPDMGTLTANTELGIFGALREPRDGELVEVMNRAEVQTGKVQIAATIDDRGVRLFDAELERVSRSADQEAKTLVIRITDPELLEKTGGIVQGMSGSPILQNGKLAGAITHVFIEDPTRGYGIFIDSMMDAAG